MIDELRFASFKNDLESALEDVEIIFRDYGYQIDDCLEDEDECEAQLPQVFRLVTKYKEFREALDERD